MSEFRTDPLFGTVSLVARERASRPRRSHTREEVDSSGPCPLCPGNEGLCPPEIGRVEENGRWEARVFPNRYPVVSLESEVPPPGFDLSSARPKSVLPGFGVHEVIVESPNHLLPFWALEPRRAVSTLQLAQNRIRELHKDSRIVYTQVFKNHKPASGGSLDHPHLQLVGLPIVPAPIRLLSEGPDCRVCRLLADETNADDEPHPRFLDETSNFVALADFAPLYPYQFSFYPKSHQAGFEEVSPEHLDELVRLFSQVLSRLERMLGGLPLNLLLYTRPNPETRGSTLSSSMHWFFRVCPRMGRKAGFELSTGLSLVHVAPEDMARAFREKGL